MCFDYRIYKPILAFLPFGFRSVLVSLKAEDAFLRPQAYSSSQKSTRGNKPKGMQKSDKKSVLIPYLDNIEITVTKIFIKTTEILGKSDIFFLNRLLSLINSTLCYDRILFEGKKESLRELSLNTITRRSL